MSRPLPMPPPGFDDLPVGDKTEYVQAPWDRIAAGTEQVPLVDWQAQILEERLAVHEASPEEARPWEEVLQELRERLRGSR